MNSFKLIPYSLALFSCFRKEDLWNEEMIQEIKAVVLFFSVRTHHVRKSSCMTNIKEVKAALLVVKFKKSVGRKSLLVPVTQIVI